MNYQIWFNFYNISFVKLNENQTLIKLANPFIRANKYKVMKFKK